MVEAFGQLAKHAEREGVVIALEPLNRYENHMINTLAQAKALCEEVGSAHFGIAADTYHMNIEETDPLQSLVDAVAQARPAQRQQPARTRRGPPGLVGPAQRCVGDRIHRRAGVRVPAVRTGRRGVARRRHTSAPAGMGLTTAELGQPTDRERLLRHAVTVLINNWRGHATVPSRGLYPHQWSWDSAFIALGLQHVFPRRAAIELLSLLGGQWRDGRVPHIVFIPGRT